MKNKKLVAGVLAATMAFAPMHALGQTINTPQINQNYRGITGTSVFEGQLDGGTWGLRVSDFTDGMNQINLSVSIDGELQSWRADVRPHAVFMFTVPDAGGTVEVLASTNANSQGSFTLHILEQATGTDSFTLGTYQGVATNGGFQYTSTFAQYDHVTTPNNAVVSVTVSDSEILSIELVSHGDTEGWMNRANPALLDAIVLAQSTDVDLITSATFSSEGLLQAVEAALEAARGGDVQLPALEDVTGMMPEMPVLDTAPAVGAGGFPVATATFTPGSHTIEVPGWQDYPMVVQTTFSENQITAIEIISHNESKYGSGWALRAIEAVPDQIMVHQSTQGLDSFTGATSTQESIVLAVETAISDAGVDPADLEPQLPTAPLLGDSFIPGLVEITVPHSTHNLTGTGAADGSDRMLYSQEHNMYLRVSFGRNSFHLHQGNVTNANLAQLGHNNSHGESAYAIAGITADSTPEEINDAIGGGTWGGWFFRQVVNHQINDTQSTQGIDIATGATMSAAGILWGVEQAMIEAGANPAEVTPRAAVSQLERNPSAEPTVNFFNPGIYTVTVDGYLAPMEIRVTLDRTHLRRIEILSHDETPSFFNRVWGGEAEHVLRNALYIAQGTEGVDTITGATGTSQAIIDAVAQAMEQAWID